MEEILIVEKDEILRPLRMNQYSPDRIGAATKCPDGQPFLSFFTSVTTLIQILLRARIAAD